MTRFFVQIEYDGTNYHGFQKQPKTKKEALGSQRSPPDSRGVLHRLKILKLEKLEKLSSTEESVKSKTSKKEQIGYSLKHGLMDSNLH